MHPLPLRNSQPAFSRSPGPPLRIFHPWPARSADFPAENADFQKLKLVFSEVRVGRAVDLQGFSGKFLRSLSRRFHETALRLATRSTCLIEPPAPIQHPPDMRRCPCGQSALVVPLDRNRRPGQLIPSKGQNRACSCLASMSAPRRPCGLSSGLHAGL